MQDASRYSGVAISLHWLVAAFILALLVIGPVMTDLTPGSHAQFFLYQLHKSFGFTVLLLVVLRLAWRLTHTPPALPASMPPWEQRVAHLGHWVLYGLLFLLPLEGWAVVSASVYNIPTVLYGVLPVPHLPILSTLPDKKPVAEALGALHEGTATLLLIVLAGHAGAALRHHILLKDDVLRRMLPRWLKL